MQIEVLQDNYNFANTYLVSNGTNAIIIDPACDIKYLKKQKLDRFLNQV